MMGGKVVFVGAGWAVRRDDGDLVVFGGGPRAKERADKCARGELPEAAIRELAIARIPESGHLEPP